MFFPGIVSNEDWELWIITTTTPAAGMALSWIHTSNKAQKSPIFTHTVDTSPINYYIKIHALFLEKWIDLLKHSLARNVKDCEEKLLQTKS